MKKVLLSVLCLVVIFPGIVFGEAPVDKLAPNAPGAHMWDKFDIFANIPCMQKNADN